MCLKNKFQMNTESFQKEKFHVINVSDKNSFNSQEKNMLMEQSCIIKAAFRGPELGFAQGPDDDLKSALGP